MDRFWQAVAAVCLLLGFAHAEPKGQRTEWQPLKITQSLFPREMGMLDAEREEYADHLAGLAVGRIRKEPASVANMMWARRMMALALHLSPRNKRAVVANFQLGRGLVPEAVDAGLLPESFSRLLFARGQMLEKQSGHANLRLARYLYELATELDPKNEEAIYLSELRRLEQGEINWSELTDPQVNP